MRCSVGSAPHRPDRRAGLRSRSSRELRVIRLRSAFSACSARVSNCFRCCSKRAFVTGLFAAAAFIAHLCANCRRCSDRTLMSCPISGKQWHAQSHFPGSSLTVSSARAGAGAHNRAASSVAEAMNFRWLPITSLQSLFAEFVPALLQCLAPEREAGWRTDGAASDYFFGAVTGNHRCTTAFATVTSKSGGPARNANSRSRRLSSWWRSQPPSRGNDCTPGSPAGCGASRRNNARNQHVGNLYKSDQRQDEVTE